MSALRGMASTWPGRLLALVVVAVLVGGVTLVQRVTAAPEKAEFRTASVTRGSVTQTVAVSGSVNAAAQARLNFKSSGRLATIAVSVGQQVKAGDALAKLDTSDLEIALANAEANLASAQANYNRTVQSASDARKSLDETQKTTANDLLVAQQAFSKVKANYAAAKTNYVSYANAIRSDVSTYQSGITQAQGQLGNVQTDLQSVPQTGDVRSALTSVNQAQASLANAASYGSGVLGSGINDYATIEGNLVTAMGGFDAAAGGGADTAAASQNFQIVQASYTTAATRVSNGFDVVNAQLASAQATLASAQTSLNSTASRGDTNLDQSRIDLLALQNALTNDQQLASAAKAKITQAGTALATIADAVSGSYVSAQQNVASTQERNNQSVQSAQATVSSKPFDIASSAASQQVQEAAVQTAQTNLDNATLRAPLAGVVASINAQVGEFVSAGGTSNPFILLANTAQVALHGTIGEADVAKLKLGQVANVTVDAVGTGTRMTGKVTNLDPVATLQQGVPVYGVDVTIDVPNTAVRPGMTGTAAVIIANKTGVLTVPNLAIRSTGGQRLVQVLKDGQPIDTSVTFGIANDTVTEVVTGLAEGELVVLPTPRAGAGSSTQIRIQGPGGPPGGPGR